MKTSFDVCVLNFAVLREIAGVWNTQDYVALLEVLEFDDIAGLATDEIYDVCLYQSRISST